MFETTRPGCQGATVTFYPEGSEEAWWERQTALQSPFRVGNQWRKHVNLAYVGGWDLKDRVLRLAQASSSKDPISKISRAKWTGGVARAVESLLCKHEALSSNSSPTKKNQKTKKEFPQAAWRTGWRGGQWGRPFLNVWLCASRSSGFKTADLVWGRGEWVKGRGCTSRWSEVCVGYCYHLQCKKLI
jgi:hypothetical protein